MTYKCRLGFGAVMMQVEVKSSHSWCSQQACLERLDLHGTHLMPVGSACILMMISITTITTIIIIIIIISC